ncbi:MAG: hypothetical protein Q9195_002518 [Heterodermia aff. obscurata]
MSLNNSDHPAGSDMTDIDQALPNMMAETTLHTQGTTENTVIQSISTKLRKAKDTSIDVLPTEILEQILSYTEDDPLFPSQTNDEYPLLKTMRLVNAAFNKVASPFLFRTMVLYEHPTRYAALNSIANVPYLAPLVEGVDLAELGYLPDCSHYGEQLEREQCDCRSNEECGSFDLWQLCRTRTRRQCYDFRFEPPAGGPLSKLDFSPKEMYKRYVSWRDGERTMKEHVRNGTAPSLDLDRLPNLRHVESVGRPKMRTLKWTWSWQSEPRRFIETGLIAENGLKGIPHVPLCHLPTFLIAASACSKNLTSLTIHRLDELFKFKEYNNDNPALQLRSLHSLRIDLADVWYSYDSLNDPAELAPWVHSLQNLEELRIYQNSQLHDGLADVVRLLRHVNLPKLAKFVLHDGLVGYKILKTFLSKHDSTLRWIEVVKPMMEQERWEKLKERYIPGGPLAHGKEVRLSKFLRWNFFTDRDEGWRLEFR